MRAKRNAWYAAAAASELPAGTMVERTILEELILLFRTDDGRVSGIGGLCPHRFAPLALGRMIDGAIECGYHGLRFNGDGECIHNPRGDGRISGRTRVKGYALVERFNMIWIWMGESDLADPDLLPDFSFVGKTPDNMRIEGYLVSKANYAIVVDNLLDPSHADYVHPALLNSYGCFSNLAPRIEREDRAIAGIWAYNGQKSQPIYHALQADPESLTDQWHSFKWHEPSIVEISMAVCEPGSGQEFHGWSFHAVTPIDEHNSHYWFISCRNFADLGHEFNELSKANIFAAFVNEDGPMVEAIDKAMAGRSFWEMEPAILDGDQVATLVRRRLETLIREEETGQAA